MDSEVELPLRQRWVLTAHGSLGTAGRGPGVLGPPALTPCPPRPLPRWPPGMSKRQSLSTFSSENFSDGDGDEGHTSEPSHSATPDVGSTNTDERPDDRSEDLLSQGSEIPLDAAPPEGPGRRHGGSSPTKVMPPPRDGHRGVGGPRAPRWGWQREGAPLPRKGPPRTGVAGDVPAPVCVPPGLRGLGL